MRYSHIQYGMIGPAMNLIVVPRGFDVGSRPVDGVTFFGRTAGTHSIKEPVGRFRV